MSKKEGDIDIELEFDNAIRLKDEEKINSLIPLLLKKKPKHIFKAIEEANLEKVKLLLDSGIPLEIRHFGGTPLLTAVFELTEIYSLGKYYQGKDETLSKKYSGIKENLIAIIHLLTEKGADVNACTPDKTSVLHLASTLADSDLAEYLKHHGAKA